MATLLCWENIKPGCDAYSPDNPICFANGHCRDTCSGRRQIRSGVQISKSLPGLSVTAFPDPGCRSTSKRGVVIHGASENWVHIFIDDDRVEFRDATTLWVLAHSRQKKRFGMTWRMTRCENLPTIGPAGENMVRYANVTNEPARPVEPDMIGVGV